MKDDAARRRILTPRGALLGMIVAGLLFTSVYPLRRYAAVKHELKTLEQEERQLATKLGELERHKELLRTDEQVELLAREKLGMARPGEVRFVIPKAPEARDPEPRLVEPTAAPAEHETSLFGRWWASVRGVLRVVR